MASWLGGVGLVEDGDGVFFGVLELWLFEGIGGYWID